MTVRWRWLLGWTTSRGSKHERTQICSDTRLYRRLDNKNTNTATRELKQNSRGRRRQRRSNNKTNYTRQRAHVNMWNKADICAILLSNETSTAPFARCLQNVADISRTNVHRFVQKETLESTEFQRKRNIQGNQSKDMFSKIRGLRRNIFFASDVGVVVLVCLRSLLNPNNKLANG